MRTKFFVMPRNPTFRDRVYNIVKDVPEGETISYKEIAVRLKSSPRAVGQAMKRNDYKNVPCHRVIHHSGKIGGYNGIRDNPRKVKILKSENIRIHQGRKI